MPSPFSLFLGVCRFEWRYRMRQPSPYLFFLILFLLTFGFVASDVVQLGGATGQALRNSPLNIARFSALFVVLGGPMIAALMGTAVQRDFEWNTHELFFTTRLGRAAYYFGRFAGAFAVTVLIFSGVLFGIAVGAVMPWVDKSTVAPFNPAAYASAFCGVLVPDLLFVGAILFVVGASSRALLTVYASSIVLLIGYLTASSLITEISNRTLAALIDPLGSSAIRVLTLYWTPEERNTQYLPLAGIFLANRLLWGGTSLALLAAGWSRFAFSSAPAPLLPFLTRRPKAAERSNTGAEPVPAIPATGGRAATFAELWWSETRLHFTDVYRSLTFQIIVICGAVVFLLNAINIDKVFGTPSLPTTRTMTELIQRSFTVFFLALITFVVGELVWRERTLRLAPVRDSLPAPATLALSAKISAVVLLLAAIQAQLMALAMACQLVQGYTHIEIGLYLTILFVWQLPALLFLSALAFFIHTVVNQKFLGHVLFVVAFVLTQSLPLLGWDHNLFLFGGGPTLKYSDMSRYGEFPAPYAAFTLYWAFASFLLLLATALLWVRGTEPPLAARLREGGARFGARAPRLVLAAGLLGIATLGGWIFYNTNVLNPYHSNKEVTQLTAGYETLYKRYAALPMPRVTAVSLDADLRPEAHTYSINGTYTLKNKTDRPVAQLLVLEDSKLALADVAIDGVPLAATTSDRIRGVYLYPLARPLPPGAEAKLTWTVRYDRRGFPNGDPDNTITLDGTFLQGVTPTLGYSRQAEIAAPDERRKQKLPVRERRAPATDLAARGNTYISNDADWIAFDATVRTAPDQTAMAPGDLTREWTENGRHCFHYQMDTPIRNFYAFLSGKWAVKRDTWTNGVQTVALSIYYLPPHPYNVDRMLSGVKGALAYCSENYSPYPHPSLRIVEVPVYYSFAQSFPGMIPFGEGVGFTSKVDRSDPDGMDTPLYIAAHETAHQWWAHVVVGGDVQGAELLSESLAEYSALMTMERIYGRRKMARFLRLDLDRYLGGRGGERDKEQPLVSVENQPYIHYSKGSLAFYALREAMGERRVNAALARFVKDKGYQEPPYATAPELVSYLKEGATPAEVSLIHDLFETITLYDLQCEKAVATKRADGKYDTTLTVYARTLHADGKGKETPAPFTLPVEVGVFAEAPRGSKIVGEPLALDRRTLTLPTTGEPRTTVTFTTDKLPVKAGIDPYNRLIDRKPEDNAVTVTKE